MGFRRTQAKDYGDEEMSSLKNIYFCIILPTLVAGLSGFGFIKLFANNLFPNLVLFFGIMEGSVIASLIRANFKWEKKHDSKTS